MIRTLVIADSGPSMASITATLRRMVGFDIVAYASGAAPVTAVVKASGAHLVLVDEMHKPGLGARRIAEIRAAEPGIAIIGLTERVHGGWAPDALRAGADAVLPCTIEPAALALVLAEVVGERPRELDRTRALGAA